MSKATQASITLSNVCLQIPNRQDCNGCVWTCWHRLVFKPIANKDCITSHVDCKVAKYGKAIEPDVCMEFEIADDMLICLRLRAECTTNCASLDKVKACACEDAVCGDVQIVGDTEVLLNKCFCKPKYTKGRVQVELWTPMFSHGRELLSSGNPQQITGYLQFDIECKTNHTLTNDRNLEYRARKERVQAYTQNVNAYLISLLNHFRGYGPWWHYVWEIGRGLRPEDFYMHCISTAIEANKADIQATFGIVSKQLLVTQVQQEAANYTPERLHEWLKEYTNKQYLLAQVCLFVTTAVRGCRYAIDLNYNTRGQLQPTECFRCAQSAMFQAEQIHKHLLDSGHDTFLPACLDCEDMAFLIISVAYMLQRISLVETSRMLHTMGWVKLAQQVLQEYCIVAVTAQICQNHEDNTHTCMAFVRHSLLEKWRLNGVEYAKQYSGYFETNLTPLDTNSEAKKKPTNLDVLLCEPTYPIVSNPICEIFKTNFAAKTLPSNAQGFISYHQAQQNEPFYKKVTQMVFEHPRTKQVNTYVVMTQDGSLGVPSDAIFADFDESVQLIPMRKLDDTDSKLVLFEQQHWGCHASPREPEAGQSLQAAGYIEPDTSFKKVPQHVKNTSSRFSTSNVYLNSGCRLCLI